MTKAAFKTCRQCGELKPISSYRKYYGGRKGTYTICKQCERINSRAKYLERKLRNADTYTQDESDELDKIYKLYEAQRLLGLQPPRQEGGRHASISDTLDTMLEAYTARAKEAQAIADEVAPGASNVPDELLKWLSADLTEEPDYYLDEVYEDLKQRYRPALSIDQQTLMPVYDDTYKVTLDKILDRFNQYEDKYYEE